METKLSDLKVGEEVFYDSNFYASSESILKITKITNTMIICDKKRFRKDSGYEIGNKDKWHFPRISILTEEKKDTIKKNQLVSFLKCRNWDYFPVEVLTEINNIVEKYKKDKEGHNEI